MSVTGEEKGWQLTLDLSLPRGIVLLEGEGGLYFREVEGGSRVSLLFPLARELLQEGGIGTEDISFVGVGRGPGSFTGVRVAVTAAKVLSWCLRKPLVEVDTLEALAAAVSGGNAKIFTAVDARRKEVYYALLERREGRLFYLLPPRVGSPREAARVLEEVMMNGGEGVAAVGNAFSAYDEAWPEVRFAGEDISAEGLAGLCRARFREGARRDPLQVLPLYVRKPDAEARFDNAKRPRGGS
jgi:tRNA threonylcarbamoyladenosine biosynthesis protein TsaB